MTNVRRTSATCLFVAVMILGGWVWSQDGADNSNSPSDGTSGTPVVDGPKETATDPEADPPADANAAVTAGPPPTEPPPTTLSTAAPDQGKAESSRWQGMILSLWIFVLAVFLGIELISKVPPTLHTPLMSGSNAISGITLVGAVIVAAAVINGLSPTSGVFARSLGFIAVTLAMINAVGGFLVTHRMLAMFTRK